MRVTFRAIVLRRVDAGEQTRLSMPDGHNHRTLSERLIP